MAEAMSMDGGGDSSFRGTLFQRQTSKVRDRQCNARLHPAGTTVLTPSQRPFSAMQDTQRSESPSLFVSPRSDDDHYNNEHAAYRRRLHLPTPTRTHFPGDGLDFRRPMPSNANPNPTVIDLTDEDDSEQSQASEVRRTTTGEGSSRASRLPRFGRDVIDLDSPQEERDGTASRDPRLRQRQDAAPSRSGRPTFSNIRLRSRQQPDADADDIQVISSRPLSRVASRQPTPAAPARTLASRWDPRTRDLETRNSEDPSGIAIDLTEDDDDLILVNARARNGVNLTRPAATAGAGTRSIVDRGIGHIARILQGEGVDRTGRLIQRLGLYGMQDDLHAHIDHHHHHHHDHPVHFHPPPPRMPMPGMMDYGAIGFDLGLGGDHRPPTPKYSPPPSPEPGFTRSPSKDEVVVCPNCGDELGMGEDETKRQIWVIKGCGHVSLCCSRARYLSVSLTISQVYCGDCTQKRTRSVSKKGKGRATDHDLPQPFKKCVVEGCGKSTSKAAMFQLKGL